MGRVCGFDAQYCRRSELAAAYFWAKDFRKYINSLKAQSNAELMARPKLLVTISNSRLKIHQFFYQNFILTKKTLNL